LEIEEIKREEQTSQKSQPAEREEEMLVHMGTIKDDEYKPNTVTTIEETETQHRDQTNKLREKIESMYYQVTQITMDNGPRLQKLQKMFKLKVIMKTANEAMREIQSSLGLRVTWFASVLEDEQNILINCNLIYERGLAILAIRVVCIRCFVFVCRASRDHY
jgi:hypothetical protein